MFLSYDVIRRVLFVVGVLLLLAVPVMGQEISGSVGARDKYLGNNAGVFHPEPIGEANVTFTSKGGWWVDVWRAQTIDGECDNYGCETDLSGGLPTIKLGKFDLDLSGSYFSIYKVEGDANMYEIIAQVSSTLDWGDSGSVKKYFVAEHYQPVKGMSPGAGQIYRIGLERYKPGDRIDFTGVIEGFWDSGAFNGDDAFCAHLAIELSHNLTEHFSVYIGGKYYWVLTDVNDGREDDGEVSGGTRFGF